MSHHHITVITFITFYITHHVTTSPLKTVARCGDVYYKKKKPVVTVCFLKIGECREVLGGGPAPPSKL